MIHRAASVRVIVLVNYNSLVADRGRVRSAEATAALPPGVRMPSFSSTGDDGDMPCRPDNQVRCPVWWFSGDQLIGCEAVGQQRRGAEERIALQRFRGYFHGWTCKDAPPAASTDESLPEQEGTCRSLAYNPFVFGQVLREGA